MRTSLDSFLKELNEINTFVVSVNAVYDALTGFGDKCITDSLNLRRRLDYLSFIIALYTSLEKFVEDLAWSFVSLESTRNRYSELNEKLKDKHLKKSAEILLKGRLGEGRYERTTTEDIVNNLNECLRDSGNYSLNRDAVVFHESNIRSEIVQGIFTSIGIDNINSLACQTEHLTRWFTDTQGFEDSDNNLPKILNLKLRDLVDRRNQLVHAGTSSLEAFGPEVMKEIMIFFEAYGKAIFDVVAGFYLSRYYINNPSVINLGQPKEGPYKNGFVVVVEHPKCKIFQGQPILGAQKNRVVRWGKILQIQVDGEPVESIEADSSVPNVGLEVDFKLWNNVQLLGLEKKDEAIWD